MIKKKELVELLSKQANLTRTDSDRAIIELVNIITTSISNGEEVLIPGLGKFERIQRKARKGINPSTGVTINIPAKNAPKFKAAKALKDAVV